MNKKRIFMLSSVLLLLGVILIGTISAYFTDGDSATNEFTIGKISIDLEEPNWTPPENILPNEPIKKDPQVANTGKNEAFVYLEVHVPRKSIITAEDNGSRKDLDYVDLFTYEVNQGWEQVEPDIINGDEVIRIYAYSKDGNCTPLAKDETTPPLFDEVVFTNAIEDQRLEETTQNILINAYGIQTNNINGDKVDNASVWEVIKNQKELTFEEDISLTENQTLLMNGENFNTLFSNNFSDATKVEFTKENNIIEAIPRTTTIDFSEKQDGSILGWQEGDTVYISSEKDIIANKDCSLMFNSCDKLTNISFSNFDTSKTTNMRGMFVYCESLIELDLSRFDTSNVTDMAEMFVECSGLTKLNISKFNTLKVKDMDSMFFGCSSLPELNLNNFDTSNVTNMSHMFCNCESLQQLNLSRFDTSNVITMVGMFFNCSSLTQLDVNNFDTSKVTNMRMMFSECRSLIQLTVNNLNTSKVINMENMFGNCMSLPDLNLNNFDTSKVTDMSHMFVGCTSLPQIDLSNFDTSNVTNMSRMFENCSSLTQLDLSNFDTANVTKIDYMFKKCEALTDLDISNFNTSKVTDMSWMFSECKNLSTLKVSKTNWIINENTNIADMWFLCKIKEPTHFL